MVTNFNYLLSAGCLAGAVASIFWYKIRLLQIGKGQFGQSSQNNYRNRSGSVIKIARDIFERRGI